MNLERLRFSCRRQPIWPTRYRSTTPSDGRENLWSCSYEHAPFTGLFAAWPLDGAVVSFLDDGFTSFPKTPRAIVGARSRLRATYRAHFQAVPGEVYFFTPLMDVTTCYFVSRLAGRCPVFLADHYRLRHPQLTRWGPKTLAKWNLLKFITGVSFTFCVRKKLGGASYSALPREQFEIKLIRSHIDPRVVERYRFPIDSVAGEDGGAVCVGRRRSGIPARPPRVVSLDGGLLAEARLPRLHQASSPA